MGFKIVQELVFTCLFKVNSVLKNLRNDSLDKSLMLAEHLSNPCRVLCDGKFLFICQQQKQESRLMWQNTLFKNVFFAFYYNSITI